MKSISKSLVLTGVLALASTSLYAGGDKCCNPEGMSSSCSKTHAASCRSHNHRHWHTNATISQADRPGYVETSKGLRFCTAKAMKDREAVHYTTNTSICRNDDRCWNKEVDASKDRSPRNPS